MLSNENKDTDPSAGMTDGLSSKWCLEMLIPFDPDMRPANNLEAFISHSLEKAEEKLKAITGKPIPENFLKRLGKIKESLLSQSYGKTLYLSVSDQFERIIPLNFKTRPAIAFNINGTILNLVNHAETEPHFFIVSRDETGESVYEFCNKKLLRIYYNEIPGPVNSEHCRFLSSIMNHTDISGELPVFLTGNRGGQLSGMCSERVFMEHVSGFYPYNIEHKARTIADNWNYWHKKAIEGRINAKEGKNLLHTGKEEVGKALSKDRNGLLLLIPTIIPELNEAKIKDSAESFISLIESFLMRGNRIETMTYSSITNNGGIVLLENPTVEYQDAEMPVNSFLHHAEPILL